MYHNRIQAGEGEAGNGAVGLHRPHCEKHGCLVTGMKWRAEEEVNKVVRGWQHQDFPALDRVTCPSSGTEPVEGSFHVRILR